MKAQRGIRRSASAGRGGTESGRPMRAVQVGGPFGAYFPPSKFDMAFDYEPFTQNGVGGRPIRHKPTARAGSQQRCTPHEPDVEGSEVGLHGHQIAVNFAVAGDEKAALATAEHISTFWGQMMRQRLVTRAARQESGLSSIAAWAVGCLVLPATPQHHSQATKFRNKPKEGTSDAG
jgi:hypothetical protein